MPNTKNGKTLKGKDLITIGIFSAIYFVINFAFMLLGGLHPMMWILMPAFIALFSGIPFMLMCTKVQKPGAVLLMGLITGLIYFVTGQFTVEAATSLPEARTTDLGKGLMVEGLTCGYKKEAAVFENLSFAVMPGEVLAVTGCNGTGKTTLVRCLCGLLKEWSGRISLYGKRLNAKARLKESFLVMQDVNHQLFYESVWSECEQAAGREVQQTRIRDVLERFGLLELKDRHPMSLSGGQKQRLAVATALLSDKKLLVFDEPTSGLDFRHMMEVSKVIRNLAEQGHMILVVSHDREFMEKSCDRILEV